MRKKVIALVLTSALLMAAAGCGNTGTQSSGGQTENTQPAVENTTVAADDAQEDTQNEEQTTGDVIGAAEGTAAVPEETEDGSRILVAYFSWADNAVTDENVDAVSSPSVTAPGNVQELAG